MAENMMNKDHKATNKKYRDNYDKTFRNNKPFGVYEEGDCLDFPNNCKPGCICDHNND